METINNKKNNPTRSPRKFKVKWSDNAIENLSYQNCIVRTKKVKRLFTTRKTCGNLNNSLS